MTYNFVYLDSNNKLTNLNAFDFNINTISVNNNTTLQGPLQINNNINITENTNYNTFFLIKNKSNQSKFSINTNTGNTDIKGSLKVGDIMPQSGINLSNPNPTTAGNKFGSATQAFEHIYAKYITVSKLANFESDTISVLKDLNIDGNINIKGNVANISTNNLVVEDSLIILANNNKNDSFFDIGLYAEYTDNSNKFTGFVRKSNTKKWTLFKDITIAPNSTNITDNISVNQIDTLVANIEGNKLNISGNSSISENLNVLGNLTITNGLVVPYNNNYNNVKGSIYYDNTNNKFFGHYADKGWKNLGGIDDTTDTSISQNLSVSRNLNVIGNITLNDTLFIQGIELKKNNNNKLEINQPIKTTLDGNAATATKLETFIKIGGVSFDGSVDIDLPGVNTAGNQDTSGTASKIDILRETTNYPSTVKTFIVTAGGGKYSIDGTQTPQLNLLRNNTYIFNLDNTSLSSHPFLLSTTSDGTNNSGAVYNNNVIYKLDNKLVTQNQYTTDFSSASPRELIFTPSSDLTLYYFCNFHSGMGGIIKVTSSDNRYICFSDFNGNKIKNSVKLSYNLSTGALIAPNFIGNVNAIDLKMTTNTSGNILIADSTSFKPKAITGDATINNQGSLTLKSDQTNITSLLANNIKIGHSDSNAKIHFNSNQIDFYSSNSIQITLSNQELKPQINNINLGSNSNKFNDAYFEGNIYGNLEGNATTAGTADKATALNTTTNGIVKTTSSNGTLSIGSLVSGDIPNNAADTSGSAAKLTNAITIGGVSFDGSLNIVPKTIQILNSSSTGDKEHSILFIDDTTTTNNTEKQPQKLHSKLKFNTTSGVLTATKFSGDGSLLTALNASEITTGILNKSRIPPTLDNLTLTGNLNVNGTTTTIHTTDLVVEDGLIQLSKGQTPNNSKDIGLYHHYDTNKYAGFAKKAGSQNWYLFQEHNETDLSSAPQNRATLYANLNGNVTGSVTGNAGTATKLAATKTIGGVAFDGSANIDLPGVNTGGNQDTTGNATTSTKLAATKTIGGVAFDGSANIDLPGVNASGNQDTSGNAATVTNGVYTSAVDQTIGGSKTFSKQLVIDKAPTVNNSSYNNAHLLLKATSPANSVGGRTSIFMATDHQEGQWGISLSSIRENSMNGDAGFRITKHTNFNGAVLESTLLDISSTGNVGIGGEIHSAPTSDNALKIYKNDYVGLSWYNASGDTRAGYIQCYTTNDGTPARGMYLKADIGDINLSAPNGNVKINGAIVTGGGGGGSSAWSTGNAGQGSEFIYPTNTNQRVVIGFTANTNDYKLKVNGDSFTNGPVYVKGVSTNNSIRIIGSGHGNGSCGLSWYKDETDAKNNDITNRKAYIYAGTAGTTDTNLYLNGSGIVNISTGSGKDIELSPGTGGNVKINGNVGIGDTTTPGYDGTTFLHQYTNQFGNMFGANNFSPAESRVNILDISQDNDYKSSIVLLNAANWQVAGDFYNYSGIDFKSRGSSQKVSAYIRYTPTGNFFRGALDFGVQNYGNVPSGLGNNTTYATTSATTAMRIAMDGKIGMGVEVPSEKLHVNGNIRVNGITYNSSDSRIKTNIEDVPDNLALEQLRNIPCRYYEYIDKINSRNNEKTIGFIAQEVKSVLPMSVSQQKQIIPNIYKIINCTWTINIDKFSMSSTDLLNVSGVKYKFYVSNASDGSDEKMVEIIGNSDNTFTFDNQYTNVFCYGSEVDDFHILDKNKLFILNFSASQELDRIQQTHITKIETLETENATLKAENIQQQTEINTLKSIIDKLTSATSFDDFKSKL